MKQLPVYAACVFIMTFMLTVLLAVLNVIDNLPEQSGSWF